MNIFFDLDGTLLDSKMRFYSLFQDLVPFSNISLDKYWELKRNKIDHKTILIKNFNYSEEDFNLFEKNFYKKIELNYYLKFDSLVDGTYETLDYLVNKYKLYLVTMRQKKINLYTQLKKLNIYKYFFNILITKHKQEKIKLIRSVQYQNDDFFIGDTGYDILTGIRLGMHTIATCYGFSDKQVLIEYKPEFLIDSLSEIFAIL